VRKGEKGASNAAGEVCPRERMDIKPDRGGVKPPLRIRESSIKYSLSLFAFNFRVVY